MFLYVPDKVYTRNVAWALDLSARIAAILRTSTHLHENRKRSSDILGCRLCQHVTTANLCRWLGNQVGKKNQETSSFQAFPRAFSDCAWEEKITPEPSSVK